MSIVRIVKLPYTGLECDCVNVGLTCTKDHLLSYLFEYESHEVSFNVFLDFQFHRHSYIGLFD
jgi:hypothetical protein